MKPISSLPPPVLTYAVIGSCCLYSEDESIFICCLIELEPLYIGGVSHALLGSHLHASRDFRPFNLQLGLAGLTGSVWVWVLDVVEAVLKVHRTYTKYKETCRG